MNELPYLRISYINLEQVTSFWVFLVGLGVCLLVVHYFFIILFYDIQLGMLTKKIHNSGIDKTKKLPTLTAFEKSRLC